jgi:putative ABC transport system substrate-binding protein
MRRQCIVLLGGAALAWSFNAGAQQVIDKTARIGVLRTSLDNPVEQLAYPAFVEELKKFGFIEGKNLSVQIVSTDQDSMGLFAETSDLARSNIDLLVAEGAEIALKAATAASQTIPIVFSATNYDPIAHGYVKSLARPGGNITGIVSRQTELAAKQVELLTQAFPDRTRLAVIYDGISADQFNAAQRQAEKLRLEVQSLKLENRPYDFDAAFHSLAKGSPQMLLVLSSQNFTLSRSQIAEPGNPATATYHVHLQVVRGGRRAYLLRRGPSGSRSSAGLLCVQNT